MAATSFTLNTGATIPALGLGTWQSTPGEVKNAVAYALRMGYRLVCYGNEAEVGEGIKEALDSGAVQREDVFVTSKMWCTFSSRVEENLDRSLKDLGLDYVDLYLVHWPVAMNPRGNDLKFPTPPDGSRDLDPSWSHVETWKQMEKLTATGKARAIGVCNYSVKYLQELLRHATIMPAVNQIENHPYLPQADVEPLVQSIAAKHGTHLATVLICYHVQRGSTVLGKSVQQSRSDQNQTIIVLDTEDMEALANI